MSDPKLWTDLALCRTLFLASPWHLTEIGFWVAQKIAVCNFGILGPRVHSSCYKVTRTQVCLEFEHSLARSPPPSRPENRSRSLDRKRAWLEPVSLLWYLIFLGYAADNVSVCHQNSYLCRSKSLRWSFRNWQWRYAGEDLEVSLFSFPFQTISPSFFFFFDPDLDAFVLFTSNFFFPFFTPQNWGVWERPHVRYPSCIECGMKIFLGNIADMGNNHCSYEPYHHQPNTL